MTTIATVPHQKEINMKVSLFSSSQQFRCWFTDTFLLHFGLHCLKNSNYLDIQILPMTYSGYIRAVCSTELLVDI